MTTPPWISVIVPAYQASDTIDRCLESLAQQTIDRERYEIIVVDDGSTDRIREKVATHERARLFSQPRSGPAAARNLGIQHAQGEIVLFTDADCEPAADWIEQMAIPFQDGQVVGVKGVYLTRQQEPIARFVQIEYEDKYKRMAREKFIDFVDTYAAGYRRRILEAHGGFDPRFPVASVEDQELSFRLARLGLRMVFAPNARVYHLRHPRTLSGYLQRKFRIGYWKALVIRLHPGKLGRDSHTPQVLKVQMLLVALACAGLAASLFWPRLLWGIGVSGLLFLLTTVPFVARAWRKDHLVALISPGLLLARSLALATGFALGMLAHTGRQDPAGTSAPNHDAT